MKIKLLLLSFIFLCLKADEFNIDAILEESDKDINTKKIKLTTVVKDSKESAKKAQDDFYYKYQYNPEPIKINNGEFWCFSIKNEDMKNSCLANLKNDKFFCFSIKNEDMKNNCLANLKNDKFFCFSINNEDMKNSCLANLKNDKFFCFSINNEDIKNSCLANLKNDKSWCFYIKNEDIKNDCIANATK